MTTAPKPLSPKQVEIASTPKNNWLNQPRYSPPEKETKIKRGGPGRPRKYDGP
jgi:hypothetical protein